MTARTVDPATRAQHTAAAPNRSSWVSANAGSGKTRVLTNRVARLLLTGTEPQKILCLTYTRAAAAEMQTRLFATLGKWAMLDDDALLAELDALGATDPPLTPEALARARTLFARALETPGGLKIQTIHAFCEALLRRFPLEAGVPPQFRVLDEREAKALRAGILDELATRDPQAMARLARHLSGDDPDALLREIAANRARFETPFDRARLAKLLGIDPDDTLESLHARTVTADDLADLRALVPLLAASSSNDAKAGAKLAPALDAPPAERLAILEDVLLYASGAKAFTAKTGKFPTKPLRKAHPALAGRLDDLMPRVEAARPARLGIACFARSATLNRFARIWLAALDARKAALGLLDFDDMIGRTRALLSDPATAAWVLFRLDDGLDHVLVDEAQDTSPAQWQVVSALTGEFFAGHGARDVTRTVFVVGDEKQSIYSFQGADPAEFGEMRKRFDDMLSGMEDPLQRCDLIHSFRSAAPILELVDEVFRSGAGIGLENPVTHQAFDPSRPGRVEVWPFIPKPDTPEEGPWYEPVDMGHPDDPTEQLAAALAARIRRWLDDGQVLPGQPLPGKEPRPVRPGDVMILVQRRNAVFHAIIRALKRANVPVAGADVLRIGGEMAVRDLLACLRVAATPSDDLSLAALLRSPLCDVSEEGLFALAHGRRTQLRARLRESEAPECSVARELVSDLLAQADFLRPFELLQRILIRHDGRRRLAARLGAEAEDGIDSLLDQALAYEQGDAPNLTGFLDWMDSGEVTVKRRSDESADQVRVMTVHGAKGLEAPIVILPDTTDRSENANPPDVLPAGQGQTLWRARKEEQPRAMALAEEARIQRVAAENMRLLYVALTRAETWLIVCGAGANPKEDRQGWHNLTRRAMEGLGASEVADPALEAYGPCLVHATNWPGDGTGPAPAPAAPEAPSPPSLPGWARRPAAPAAEPLPPLRPSALGGAHALAPPAGEALAGAWTPEDEALARSRGEAVHLLLEHLHPLPQEARPRRGRLILPPALPGREEVLAEALAILSDPALAFLFGPGSLAEVDVTAPAGPAAGPGIFGRIDRLLVGPGRVLAVDFKSNRQVPSTPGETPDGILRQLGAYDAALSVIWPGRRVETAILWTRVPGLMTMPGELVREAFARVKDGAFTVKA